MKSAYCITHLCRLTIAGLCSRGYDTACKCNFGKLAKILSSYTRVSLAKVLSKRIDFSTDWRLSMDEEGNMESQSPSPLQLHLRSSGMQNGAIHIPPRYRDPDPEDYAEHYSDTEYGESSEYTCWTTRTYDEKNEKPKNGFRVLRYDVIPKNSWSPGGEYFCVNLHSRVTRILTRRVFCTAS